MGRASGKGRGGGASATGARVAAMPQPNRESVLLGFEDETLVYYLPEEDRLMYIEANLEERM